LAQEVNQDMITTFDIDHFKSARNVHLDCRRINLFIGEPNTGKSNILEALGFLSWCAHGGELRDYVRMDKTQDLFYDGLVERNTWSLKFHANIPPVPRGEYEILHAAAGDPAFTEPRPIIGGVSANYANGQYHFGKYSQKSPDSGELSLFLSLDSRGRTNTNPRQQDFDFIKFYRFKTLDHAPHSQLGPLLPPDGRNVAALIFASKDLRQLAADFFSPYNLKLVIKPHESKLEIQKESDGIVVSFPYRLSSDTLQRVVFYTLAIETNKQSTLVFEEPEAHAFPYFTKHLGERIALDENKNQYFIATHNPYLLSAVVEKAPADDVAVFVTYYRDYETRVKLLDKESLSRLFEADPFLGIEQFIEEGA
jgi:hypothetical protein